MDTTTKSPTTRTLAMYADTNSAGDIFGGWVLSQMDIAAGICAGQRAQGRVVTAAIAAMSFIKPVHVGDILGVYTTVVRVGRSSMDILVEAHAKNFFIEQRRFLYMPLKILVKHLCICIFQVGFQFIYRNNLANSNRYTNCYNTTILTRDTVLK